MAETASSDRTQSRSVTPDDSSYDQTASGEEFHSSRRGVGELRANRRRTTAGDVAAIYPRGGKCEDATA